MIIKQRIKIIEKNIENNITPCPNILGDKQYGNNARLELAEIIGVRPRPLSLSLYKELITDEIWAEQRKNYGYRDVTGFPLMKSFLGLPYIDLRLCFNSFIPADLNTKQPKTYQLLYRYPEHKTSSTWQNRVRFSFYMLYVWYQNKIKVLRNSGFSKNECDEIVNILLNQTKNIIDLKKGKWLKDIDLISQLDTKRNILNSSKLSLNQKIFCMINDTKKYGTLPFAGLARTAFIAVSLLKSLVNIGVITEIDYDNIIRSVSTVSSDLSNDKGKLSKYNFLKKYGHLRPGSYDINSPRYDEEPDNYFKWKTNRKMSVSNNKFELRLAKSKLKEIDQILNANKLILVQKSLYFATEAISIRTI